MSVFTNDLSNYFKNNLLKYEENIDLNKYFKDTFFNTKQEDFLQFLREIFNVEISEEIYKSVTTGQGKEKEKITTIYSSSLQSMLIFANVSEENPFDIEGIKYTNVKFEYKNKVIGYPSSMDVVLYNKNGDVLFIESKLTEFLQSSCDVSKKGIYVIGKSYFTDKNNSYKASLRLETSELENIGIKQENPITVQSKRKDGTIYDRILYPVLPINNHKYVYSEGIKQILSHAIGINNFENEIYHPDSPKFLEKINAIRFVEITNALPGIGLDKEKILMMKEYHEHIDALKDLECLKKYSFENITYQSLWSNTNNKKYFKRIPAVVKFYHLDEIEN